MLTVRLHQIAFSTPTGLYTPIIRAMDAHSVYSLAPALKHLAYFGRQVPSALPHAELPQCGTARTVSNVGVAWDVDWGDGTGISWSAGHRFVEGAELAAFVET
jgi:2-oxoisovalerate dehydrogenase E2 component (dihydrolipoyl transacylase)